VAYPYGIASGGVERICQAAEIGAATYSPVAFATAISEFMESVVISQSQHSSCIGAVKNGEIADILLVFTYCGRTPSWPA
jgi:hypothetical protein